MIRWRTQKYDADANPGLGEEDYVQYCYNKDYQVLTETNEDGYVLRNFIFGRGLDEVLVMTDPNLGEDYYYINDHLNSPVALVDEDGDFLERYGKIKETTKARCSAANVL